MAEKQRMTGEEVVRWLMADDGADPVRESLKWMAQELMEAEVSDLVGAERGERTEDRATHRNGYRTRRWDTRAGELELAIPKLRRGSYFPSFLQPRKRSEQALVAVVQEAYVAGVSTRKVDQVVESLGLRVSKSEVSRICGGLDEQAGAEADERCRVKARVVERQVERRARRAARTQSPLGGCPRRCLRRRTPAALDPPLSAPARPPRSSPFPGRKLGVRPDGAKRLFQRSRALA
jgi:hypothetical protein